MAIKGLIFDMDGTLLDSMGFWRGLRGQICAHFGVPTQGETAWLANYGTPWEAVREYLHTHLGVCSTPAEFWDLAYRLACDFYGNEAVTMPHAAEFLRAMKEQGYLLGVATATARPAALIGLEHTGLLPLLDAVISVDEIGVPKTRPDVYLECARLMGNLKKDEVVVFEDALYCVNTLRTHGFTVVGVHDRNTPAREWDTLVPLCDRTIEDYQELL